MRWQNQISFISLENGITCSCLPLSLPVSLGLSLFVSLLRYSLVDRAVHYAMLQPSFTIRNAPLPKSIFKINENKARAL